MSDVRNAQPEDVFVDGTGKLWRVVGRWDQPVVTMQEIEKTGDYSDPLRMQGGVSGLMWDGFNRIYQKEAK